MKNEQVFFSLKDFRTLYKRNRRLYFTVSSVVFLSLFAAFAFSPVKYESEAKLKKTTSSEAPPQLRSFLSAIPFVNFQSTVVSCLKSKDFLRSVIEDAGLQAQVFQMGWIERKIANAALTLSPKKDEKILEKKQFIFTNVEYKNSSSKKMTLRVLNNQEFIVVDREYNREFKGKISEPLVMNDVTFTLKIFPDRVSYNTNYDMQIRPMHKVLDEVSKSFVVKTEKEEADVLVLKFSSTTQETSQRFLTQVLSSYIEFIKEENAKICDQQSKFLGERKKFVEKNYANFLDEHAGYLEENLQNDGFLGMHQQLMMFEKPNGEYNTRLYDVNLDISRLSSVTKNNVKNELLDDDDIEEYHKIKKRKAKSANLNDFIIPISSAIQNYMSCDYTEKAKLKSQYLSNTAVLISNDLDKIVRLKNDSQKVLDLLESGNLNQIENINKTCCSQLIKEYIDQIAGLQKKINTLSDSDIRSLEDELADKKSRFQEMLSDIISLAETQKENLLKKSIDEFVPESELAGINPETVQHLYIDYNHELDAVILNIKQLNFVKDQIDNSDVEVSSLSNLLNDPVSQNMIQKASQLALELRDESNRSSKESERIKESLFYQKQFLGNHIAQMICAQKIKAKLIKDKIDSLQKVSIKILNNEKKLIEDRLTDIRSKMSHSLPKKWKSENMLLLKKEIYSGIIENLAKMEESKIIDKNMKFSDYSVLDKPSYPLFASDKGILIYPGLIAFLSFISLYFFHFVKRISRGSPVSEELLTSIDFPYFAKLSSIHSESIDDLNESDFESLRKMAHFVFDNKKTSSGILTSLLGSAHKNFSGTLACLLTQRGSNVLVLDMVCKGRIETNNNAGLYAYLTGMVEAPEVIKSENADYIYVGNSGRFFVESISQPKFKEFIEEKKRVYDFIIINSCSDSASVESQIYQSFSDVCLVSCDFNNSIQEFYSLFRWNESKNNKSLSFVLVES